MTSLWAIAQELFRTGSPGQLHTFGHLAGFNHPVEACYSNTNTIQVAA